MVWLVGKLKINERNLATWIPRSTVCSRERQSLRCASLEHGNISVSAVNAGTRSSLVGWGTMLQVGNAGLTSDEVDFFNLPNPSSGTMALGSTPTLTEMSTRNLPGGKGRPARKAHKLSAICEPIV
jgi:hypothetical protein